MATGSLLTKIFIFYFSINLILFASGVRVGQYTDSSGNSRDLVGDLISTSDNQSSILNNSNQYGLGTIGSQTPDVNQQTGGISGALSFIDVVRAVGSFVNFILVMLVGIFIVFLPFPAVIQLFVGVPMALLFLFGLMYFVRSGQ